MTDLVVDLGALPDDIREKLAELDLELSEGNCTLFHHHLYHSQIQTHESINRHRKNQSSKRCIEDGIFAFLSPICERQCHFGGGCGARESSLDTHSHTRAHSLARSRKNNSNPKPWRLLPCAVFVCGCVCVCARTFRACWISKIIAFEWENEWMNETMHIST